MKDTTSQRSHSLSYAEDTEHPLCLCEYHNKNNERVHLLMCCCNCEAIDSLCTSFLCGCCDSDSHQGMHRSYLLYESLNDIFDRIRYPYIGGARKFNWDFMLSVLCILAYDYIGSINLVLTVLMIFIGPSLLYSRFFLARLRMARTQYRPVNLKDLATNSKLNLKPNQERIQIAHFTVLNALIYLLYRANSSLYGEIGAGNKEKNVLNFLIVVLLCIHLYLHNADPGSLKMETSSKENKSDSISSYNKSYCTRCNFNRNDQVGHCTICKSCILKRDHHCFWVDNCIGYFNHKIFILYLLCLLILAFYSFLILFVHFHTIDCVLFNSEEILNQSNCIFNVFYSNSNKGFLFLILIQLLPIVFYLGMLITQQILFISIGKTQQELFRLSQTNYRFSLVIFIKSNLSLKLFYKNWVDFLKFRKKENLLSFLTNEHQV